MSQEVEAANSVLVGEDYTGKLCGCQAPYHQFLREIFVFIPQKGLTET